MQIIIPMSGFGERFRRAGYTVPKPLIEIEGKPIIAHVIDMFDGETDFIFICNREHLDEPAYAMADTLKRYCPTGKIIAIDPHKLGPVHAVLSIAEHVASDAPTIVNYCDFTCYWDWQHFKSFAAESRCAGALPAYKGFHPHSLGTTNYAYMREKNGWMLDIQEKQPFTDNRMEEFASSGTYYFSSGALMLDVFELAEKKQRHINGEYYVSLAYLELLERKLPVAVYPLQHFMQWGTPADVHEYNNWSSIFRSLMTSRPKRTEVGSVVVPMAGLGQRFANEGYVQTKPLIDVSGKPMVIQATDHLPAVSRRSFVLRADMPGIEEISTTLANFYPGAVLQTVATVTEGQACTALLGLDALQREETGDVQEPITFGACDFAALYSAEKLETLMQSADVLVWTVRNQPQALRHPQMFGWVAEENGRIKSISVKTPLSNPSQDPIVLGTFTFRRAEDFRRCIQHMIDRDARINGEFYLDTCINDAVELGLDCRIFEVDAYISWGTPNDLRTFEYWQSCFSKWAGHPYELELDVSVADSAIPSLREKYRKIVPEIPQ